MGNGLIRIYRTIRTLNCMNIMFCGDVCVTNPIIDTPLPSEILSKFTESDFRFCCLEAPIVSDIHKQKFPKAGPSLKQHNDICKIIKHFTHVSLANNHIMDYCEEGLKDTLDNLRNNDITYGGAGLSYDEIYHPIILEKNDLKVAVLCLAEAQFGSSKDKNETKPGYAWIFNADNYKKIEDLKKSYDYVICFVHAGLEMADLPLPEWRMCYRSLIDYGCDLVIGGHPHVIQGKEIYKGKFIYYSLGNFFFNCPPEGVLWNHSLSLQVHLEKELIKVDEIFTKFDQNFITVDDEQNINALTQILEQQNYDAYLEKINREVLKHWNEYYESYFSYPILNASKTLKTKIFQRFILKYVLGFFRPKVSTIMLYHNMIVDTHRFAISRAISLMNKTY